ncbi:MAG TPA: AAA family ATPase [Verrucomicrobiae bacterium]|nr:AAA family ATPase [Verrucomicrobiae bacterium]
MNRPLSGLVSASGPLEVLASVRASQQAERSQGHTGAGSGVEVIEVGNRHNAVLQIIGSLRRQGYGDHFIASVVGYISQRLMEEPGDPEKLLDMIRGTGDWTVPPPPEIEFIVDETGVPAIIGEPAPLKPRLLYHSKLEPPEPIEWLWEHYVPLGFCSMLAGVEGIGKGMMSTWLAVREAKAGRPVIWFASEDDPQRDIQKRVQAAGWTEGDGEIVYWDPLSARFTFPRDEDVVVRMIQASGARLLILDPGRSFVTPPEGAPLNYNDEGQIRPTMESLTRIATATGAAILFVHHYNKNTDGSIRNRSGGTGAFSQVVRHRIDVAKAGTDDWAEWAMAVVKSNVANEGFLRSYRLDAAPDHDTAIFVPGERITDHPDIAAWEHTRQKALTDADKAPLDDYSMLELAYDAWVEVGTESPGIVKMAKLASLPEKRAGAAMAIMQEQGRLQLDAKNHRIWRG